MEPRSGGETLAHPGHGHEKSDVGVRPLVLFVVGLIVSLAVVIVVIAGLLEWFARSQRPSPGAIAILPPLIRPGPTEPMLQQSPASDMDAMRAREAEALRSFEWVDRKKGIVTIPIEDAMRLVAEKGLSPKKAERREEDKKQDDR